MIVNGASGAESLWGSTAADAMTGFDGNDFEYGLAGNDTLDGGNGIDYLVGGDGDDTIYGGADTDHLVGGNGVDHLYGDTGSDYIEGGPGADVMDGGDTATLNYLSYRDSSAAVTVNLEAHTASGGDATGDSFVNFQNLDGSAYDDHLTGTGGTNMIYGGAGNDIVSSGAGYDYLYGQDGNDILRGGAGSDYLGDTLDGGNGIDTVTYSGSPAGVTVNLATGTGSGGDAAGDVYVGIEQAIGSAANDVLIGNAGANTLWGDAGNDRLVGGAGADLLKGGAGSDAFVYTGIADSTVALAGKDTIADFSGGDRIDLSAIDADGNGGNGDTAFHFDTGSFTGHAGEVQIVNFSNGLQAAYLDISGDKTPDAIINVLSDHALTAADFVL